MKSKLIQLLFVIGIIFLSGCISSGESENKISNNVMEFEYGRMDSNILQNGWGIVSFSVTNKGSMKLPARNVKVELFDPFDLEISKVICSSGTDYETTDNGCNLNQMGNDESVFVTYQLESPELSSNDLEGSIGFSVSFDYSFESSVEVPVTTLEEDIIGRESNATIKFDTQAAPIKPHVKISTDKVLEGFPFLFTLSFKNIGDGGKIKNNMIHSKDIIIELPDDISIDDGRSKDCGFKKINNNNLVPLTDFYFNGDGTQNINCWFEFTGKLDVPERNYDIRIIVTNFTYSYEKTHPITLESV